MKKELTVACSILSGDFGHLADEAQRIKDAGADAIHIDIMDGHFVPNLTFGHQVVAAIKKSVPDIFLDVHIMVYQPFDYIEKLAVSGANQVTFHFEATEDVEDTLKFIRSCGMKAGLAFCPETTESMVIKYLNKCDNLLLMTVNPGFGGQAFMPSVLDKIRFIRGLCDKMTIREGGVSEDPEEGIKRPSFKIQVDGGINLETAKLAKEAGANSFVAGTFLFEGNMMKQRIEQLKSI